MNDSILISLIVDRCANDNEFAIKLLNELTAQLTKNVTTTPVKTDAPVKTNEHWYDAFKSDNTTVKVKGSTVQVTVERGHAKEWHDELRAAGFQWSKKNHNWWAHQDAEKREKVAERNRKNDALTAGMTADEKREFWRNRRAQNAA